MLVAVPTFHGRVAPTFDFCHRITLWRVEGREVRLTGDQTCKPSDPSGKATKLQALGAEVLLCGAITHALEDNLVARGIQVLSGHAGEVPEVIEAFACGTLDEPRFQLPGAGPRLHPFPASM
jgi:predicted Fe-Mo cluster-binding NifX family protein